MQEEYRGLSPARQLRIRRTFQLSGLLAAFITITSSVYAVSRPYLDKRRTERERLAKLTANSQAENAST